MYNVVEIVTHVLISALFAAQCMRTTLIDKLHHIHKDEAGKCVCRPTAILAVLSSKRRSQEDRGSACSHRYEEMRE